MVGDESTSAPDFDRVEWTSIESGSAITRRDIGFIASLLLLGLFGIYHAFLHPADKPLPLLSFWNPLLVDWMFYGSLLVFGFYLVWPLARSGSALRRYWPALLSNRIAAVSLGWLLLFFSIGTLEPIFVDAIPFNPPRQPPIGFSIYEGYLGGCVGEVSGELCHGSVTHPLGTDGNGRDILMLTVSGMRTALQMVLITAAIIVPIGVGVGTIAGYVGGWVDEALMRYVDAQQTIPALFVYIALALLYGPSLSLMVIVFGLLNWGDVARIVRGEVLQIRETLFLTAARGAGVSTPQVIRHHVLPNVTPSVLSVTALKLPLLVIIEVTLSYLEFADPRVVSWGNIVSVGVLSGQDPTLYWWIGTVPIVVLLFTTLAITLFGNALQDFLDPRRSTGGTG